MLGILLSPIFLQCLCHIIQSTCTPLNVTRRGEYSRMCDVFDFFGCAPPFQVRTHTQDQFWSCWDGLCLVSACPGTVGYSCRGVCLHRGC